MKTNMEYTRMFKEMHPNHGIIGVTIENGMVRVRDKNYTEWFPIEED